MPLAVVNLLTLVSNPIPPPFFALHAPYALVALIVLLSLIDPCALLAFLARPSSLTIRSNGLSPNNGLYEGSLVLGAFEGVLMEVCLVVACNACLAISIDGVEGTARQELVIETSSIHVVSVA